MPTARGAAAHPWRVAVDEAEARRLGRRALIARVHHRMLEADRLADVAVVIDDTDEE